MAVSIFFTGATGYLGGSVLTAILASLPEVNVTALVRKDKDIKAVEALGVRVIKGSFSDLDIIAAETRKSDVVINTGDSDDTNLIGAILDAQKERFKGSAKKPIFIQTSGGMSVGDDTKGKPPRKEWNDLNEDDIANLPAGNLHVRVDNLIMKSIKEGFTNAYIMCPPSIYGKGTGPVGTLNTLFLPLIIPETLRQKEIVYAAEGLNELSTIHVLDIARLFVIILKLALSGTDTSGPYGRYYFSNAGNITSKDEITALARILYAKGLLPSDIAKSVKPEELSPIVYGGNTFPSIRGTTMTQISHRAKALGWKPHEPSLMELLENEVERYFELHPVA